jgi:CheY-like chemotaxis protein
MRLIAVTGYGQPDDRHRTEAAGFDLHLVKPVDPEQLALIIARTDGDSRIPPT